MHFYNESSQPQRYSSPSDFSPAPRPFSWFPSVRQGARAHIKAGRCLHNSGAPAAGNNGTKVPPQLPPRIAPLPPTLPPFRSGDSGRRAGSQLTCLPTTSGGHVTRSDPATPASAGFRARPVPGAARRRPLAAENGNDGEKCGFAGFWC